MTPLLALCVALAPPGEAELDAHYKRAAAHTAAGRHADALPEYEAALALARRLYGPDHRETGLTASNVGGTRFKVDDYARAEADLTQAIRILGGRPGQEDEPATQTRLLLGAACLAQKKFAAAERHAADGLRSLEARRGADHPDLADAWALRGKAAAGQKQWATARDYHGRALALREKHLPADAVEIAASLDGLAQAAMHTLDLAAAEALFRRAAGIREKHDDFTLVRMDPAKTRQFDERFRAGTAGKSVTINKSTNDLLSEWFWLSYLTEKGGRLREAATFADRERRYHRAWLAFYGMSSPERGRADATDTHAAGRMALALTKPADPVLVAVTASWAVNAKGMQAEFDTAQYRAARDDPALAAGLAGLVAARREVAAAALARPSDPRRTAELTARLLELEWKTVAGKAGLTSAVSDWAELDAVRRALPADTVYLDFSRVGADGKQRYAVWVVPPAGQGDVTAFDLGDADGLDALAEAARSAIQAAPRDVARLGEPAAVKKLDKLLAAAARRVLAPLLPAAGRYPRWVVCPDGDLWALPWAALPVADGAAVVERYVLEFVVSGRDVAAARPEVATGPPVILADPDYDAGGGGGVWGRLPGTATEAAAVRPKLAAWAKTEPRVLLGKDATEEAFKAVVRPGHWCSAPTATTKTRRPWPTPAAAGWTATRTGRRLSQPRRRRCHRQRTDRPTRCCGAGWRWPGPTAKARRPPAGRTAP